jgi:hypothetical protein
VALARQKDLIQMVVALLQAADMTERVVAPVHQAGLFPGLAALGEQAEWIQRIGHRLHQHCERAELMQSLAGAVQ